VTSPRHIASVVPIEAIESRASRLPPFGREVMSELAQGRLLNVYVFAGSAAWDQTKKWRAGHGVGSAMLLPPGDDPANYSWPVVRTGLLVVATGQSRAFAFNLARTIVSCGTTMVYALHGDNDALVVRSAGWRERAA